MYKKALLSLLILWFVGPLYAFAPLPNEASIDFSLSEIDRGDNCPAILRNAKLVVDYRYDFSRNIGFARLRQIGSVRWTEMLHPLGLTNLYAFMSDMAPKTIDLDGELVTIYRIIFHLHFNGEAKAMLMIGKDGDCIMSTAMTQV
jgi:hypothetical protein